MGMRFSEIKERKKVGRKRDPEAQIKSEFAGLTKKQRQQYLAGEEIDRTARLYKNWSCPKCKKLIGAQRVKHFFKDHLTHTTGKWAGRKFKLLGWQIELIDKLFGTFKKNRTRQYKQCYLRIPKKQGKSEFAAGVGLYLLVADEEGGPEIYLAAADREQASIVFNVAAQMVRNNDDLTNSVKILDSTKKLIYVKGNGLLKVVSSEFRSKHGFNISGLIFDELHAQPTRELFDVLTDGAGAARQQPLFLFLTTSGYDRNSVCWEVDQYARSVQSGTIDDPTFLPVLYGLEEGDDWENEENWARVNPSLGKIFTIENLREEFQKAKLLPAKENTFKRLRLNIWTTSDVKWIGLDTWDGCNLCPIDPQSLIGKECFGGLDLSSSTDLSAFVLVFPNVPSTGIYTVVPYFWIPGDNIEQREHRDNVLYSRWIKDGLITATPGNVIDQAFIKHRILDCKGKYDIKEIAYDRWGATKLITELTDEGLVMVQIGQGFASMNAPTKFLEALVLSKRFNHGGNPVLRWMMEGTVVVKDPADNYKPDKAKSKRRIDGVVGTIMALDRASRHVVEKKFVYDHRSISSFDRDESDSESTGQEESESQEKKSGIKCPRCEGKMEERSDGKLWCPADGLVLTDELRRKYGY